MERHIGNIIKKEYEKSGMKLNVFAERIGMSYRNVYKVFERESINTELLERISTVLNHDFFIHYSMSNSDIVSEHIPEYSKQNKLLELSLNIKFNDPEKQTELLELLFGDRIPKGFL